MITKRKRKIFSHYVMNTLNSYSHTVFIEKIFMPAYDIKKYLEEQMNKTIDCKVQSTLLENTFTIKLIFDDFFCIGTSIYNKNEKTYGFTLQIKWYKR